MDATTKAFIVVGIGAAAWFGYKAVTAMKTTSPPPTPAQRPTDNLQGPAGSTRPTSLDQFTAYGTALGAGAGAVADIYNRIWGGR